MWVVREVGGSYHMERGNIVDDNSDKLKDVDRDEFSVVIFGFEWKYPTLDLVGEVNVPPEAQFNGVAAGTFEAAIFKSCCSWCVWYHVTIGVS